MGEPSTVGSVAVAVAVAAAVALPAPALALQAHDHVHAGPAADTAATVAAHHHGNEHGDEGHRKGNEGHRHGLHFSHPLVAESVSPDTKLRLDYNFRNLPGPGTEHALGLGVEYAFSPSVSVEAGLPFSLSEGAAGFTHLALKFANYAFEEDGISLGYGLGLSLPTSGGAEEEGDHTHPDGHGHAEPGPPGAARAARVLRVRHHAGGAEAGAARAARVLPPGSTPGPRLDGSGSAVHATLGRDFWEFRPFFNLGWKTGRWELVGFANFGIPSGLPDQEEVGTELSWNASALYRAAPGVQALLEVHGHAGLSGHPVGEELLHVTPGVKLRPDAGSPLWLGLGASLPLTHDRGYEARFLASLFYYHLP